MSARKAVWAITVGCAVIVGCGPRQDPAAVQLLETQRDLWESHHALERSGDWREAQAGYQAMCAQAQPYERACYDSVRLRFETEASVEAAREAEAFVRTYPDGALAPTMVKHLARWIDELSPESRVEGATRLEQTAREVAGTDVEDTLWYEAAALYRNLGRFDDAERCWLRVLAFGRWGSQLWDDAAWRLAQLYRETGNTEGEIRVLGVLVDSDESSCIVGSYTSGRLDDGLLRLGDLLASLDRLEEAFDVYMELGDRDTSRLQDDGLFHAAQIALALDRSARACDLLKRLLTDMPDSSRGDDADELARKQGCEAP